MQSIDMRVKGSNINKPKNARLKLISSLLLLLFYCWLNNQHTLEFKAFYFSYSKTHSQLLFRLYSLKQRCPCWCLKKKTTTKTVRPTSSDYIKPCFRREGYLRCIFSSAQGLETVYSKWKTFKLHIPCLIYLSILIQWYVYIQSRKHPQGQF